MTWVASEQILKRHTDRLSRPVGTSIFTNKIYKNYGIDESREATDLSVFFDFWKACII